MMPTIDWSKPIELYDKKSGKAYADAKVVTSDLTGWYPVVVRWSIPENNSQERVDIFTTFGEPFNYDWHVRNKTVVRRQYLAVGVRSGGCVYSRSFPTKEEAEKFLMKDVVEPKYNHVMTKVVELEWTEE